MSVVNTRWCSRKFEDLEGPRDIWGRTQRILDYRSFTASARYDHTHILHVPRCCRGLCATLLIRTASVGPSRPRAGTRMLESGQGEVFFLSRRTTVRGGAGLHNQPWHRRKLSIDSSRLSSPKYRHKRRQQLCQEKPRSPHHQRFFLEFAQRRSRR